MSQSSSPPPRSPPPHPAGPTAPSRGGSWRPLFLPRTLEGNVRRGPTRTSEVPPPLAEPVPSVPALPARAPFGWIVPVSLAIVAALAALAWLARR